MEKIKIIANPTSGRDQGLAVVKDLLDHFSNDGVQLNVSFTQEAGDGYHLSKEDDGEDLLLAIGGDGTVNEVVNGLYKRKRQVPLAIYPCGTVNDLANYLKLPRTSRGFYDMVKGGRTHRVDLGSAGDRVFINVAAGGMFTDIAYSVPSKNKAVMGRMAYYLEGVRSFLTNPDHMEGFNLSIKTPDLDTTTKAFLFIVANSRNVGGFENLAPQAEIHDGQLDILVIKRMDIPKVLEFLRDLGLGRHTENEHALYFKAPWIQLEADQDLALDLDGEYGGQLPVKLEIIANAIDIVVSQEFK